MTVEETVGNESTRGIDDVPRDIADVRVTVAFGQHRQRLFTHLTASELVDVLRHHVQSMVLVEVRQPIVHVHLALYNHKSNRTEYFPTTRGGYAANLRRILFAAV